MPVPALSSPPKKRLSRGERNCNPGNIRRVDGVRWQGSDCPQKDREFVTFAEPKWGVRALARCLITYFDERYAKDGSKIDCVADVVERWAPPSENDTPAYVAHVAKLMDVDPKAELDLYDFETMKKLVRAIIVHENGRCSYDDATLSAGLIAAGLQLPSKSAGVAVETVAASVGSVGAIVAAVNAAVDASQAASGRAAELVNGFGVFPDWVGPVVAIPVAVAVLVLCVRLAHRQKLLGA